MKLKELKKLIDGCHPVDLNNELEAIVISKKNKLFRSDSVRVDTDSGRILQPSEHQSAEPWRRPEIGHRTSS